jgi:ABC-type transport system involved in multi-copper enzyme maturation permease subunit
VLLFAVLILSSVPLFVELSFAEQLKFVKDFCWGAMVIFSTVIAILGASHLMWSDIENQSLLTILAKPVARWVVIAGKFLGLAVMLALTTVFMTCASILLSEWKKGELILEEQRLMQETVSPEIENLKKQNVPLLFWQAAILVWCKALIMAAVTFLLTTLASSPMFSVLCATLIYIAGHLQGAARSAYLEGSESLWTQFLLAAIVFIIPDFRIFSALEEISIQNLMPWGYIVEVLSYTLVFCAGTLALAIVIFHRRSL